MKIGVDFDNTLANYDGLFAKLATEAGLVPDLPVWPPGEKRSCAIACGLLKVVNWNGRGCKPWPMARAWLMPP